MLQWKRRATALALCLALGLAGSSCTATPPGEEIDNEPLNASGSCGVERWSVKTGTDAAASQVNMTPQDTTISALRGQAIPPGNASGSARHPGTAEMQLWRLSNVTLTQYKLENDSDYHLVLQDGSGNTMIAEVPAPSCVSGGPWASAISASRAAMDAKFTVSSSFQSANVPVTITGVGFFDLLHGQTGVAPNGIELHAILSVCFIGSSVSGCSATSDFGLAANPSSVSTTQGSSGSSTISVTASNGFSGNVALSTSGLPAGASASFSSSSVGAGGQAALTLATGSAAAGTYQVTVSGTSGTLTHAAPISWTIAAGGGSNPDFSLVASPGSVSTPQGGSGSATLSVAGSNGFAGTVTLSVSGAPTGSTASLSPSSVSSGGSSVLALSAGSAAAGTYSLTITGQSAALSHPAALSWTISGGTGGGSVVNGGFETGSGSLTGWTSTGQTSVASGGAHGGTYAAQVGSPSPSTDSSIAQQLSLPAGSPKLTFWYKVVCPDSVQYDWASATVKSASGAVLTTPLANTCNNAGSWVQVSTDLTAFAGQTVTLSFNNHDDNYAGDPTYTLYDDVQISGGTTANPDFSLSASPSSVSGSGTASIVATGSNGFSGVVGLTVSGAPAFATATLSAATIPAGGSTVLNLAPGSAAAGTYALTITGTSGALTHAASLSWTISGSTGGGNSVVNGDFETGSGSGSGSLVGWTSTGQTSVVSSGAHGGTSAAQVGSPSPSTDSSIAQQLALPAGSPKLTFWYKVVCPDSVQYDWASATVKSASGAVLTTPLANTCNNAGTWAQVSTDLTAFAGQTVTLLFSNHDDNYAGDPTYTLYDDVQVSGGGAPAPDFSLSATPGAVTTAQGGSAAAAIAVNGSNGFAGTVSLSASGAPAGASASLSPNSVSGAGSSTLTLSAGSAAAGTYSITVNGASGALSRSTQVSWTINGTAPTPDFSLSVNPGSVSSSGAAAATANVSLSPSGGFASSVALSVSGIPSGASGAFSPSSVVGGSGSSTLTLSPGTAAAGTYSLTLSGTGGNHTHTAALSWTLSAGAQPGLQTVFIILMENHNWSSIKGSSSAPFINNTLLVQGAHAENYVNVPGIHPSEPNYLWLEAGTNFGVLNDNAPSSNHQASTQHLVTLLQNSGISWKSYQEGISGSSCPLAAGGLYAPKHNPMVFFDDVTNSNNASSANCIAHVRPYAQLATDLQSNQAARYNFITPDLCNDMHNSTGCATSDAVKNGDTWLSQKVPAILNSAAYRNGGALFITWDESEQGDHPIGMIVLSPKAKAGYSNSLAYSHSSALRTFEEIFSVSPMLGDAANATDLSDLFTSFP